MKRNLTIIALFFTVTLMAQGGVEKEVAKYVEALNEAIFVQRDSAVMQQVVGENVTYGHSGGNIEGKAEMIRNAMKSPTTYKDFGMTDLDIRVDGNTAIVRHVLKARSFDAQGKEGELHLNVLQTWIKKNKRWLLIARQAVKLL